MKEELCDQRAMQQLRTVDTSEAMPAEDAVDGRERHISVTDLDGKTQHLWARIHPVPNLSPCMQGDKTASSLDANKPPMVFNNGKSPFTLFLLDSINDHSCLYQLQ